MHLRALQSCALLAFVGLWVAIAREDALRKKVRHSWLLCGAALGAAGYAAAWMDSGALGGAFIEVAARHAAVSAAVAIGFWLLKIWPAGDAKLFVLLSLLYPLMKGPGVQPGRDALVVLINAFIPAALFQIALSARSLWRLFLQHRVLFMKELGWKRAAAFVFERWDRTLSGLRGPGVGRKLAASAGAAAGGAVFQWMPSALLAALITRLVPNWTGSWVSPLIGFAVMYLARSASERWGRWATGAAAAAICIAAARLSPGLGPRALAQGAAQWTLFGFAMGAGGRVVRSLVDSELPPGASALWAIAAFVPGLAFSSLLPRGMEFHAAQWVALGLFSGLSIACVHLWRKEEPPLCHVEELRPFSVVEPSFIERVEPELREEHFSTLYPDGLTPSQAEVLRDWCRRSGVELVPLVPTISFAFWLFFGEFLTWLTGRHVLEWLA
jgi:hypothetical protein